MRIIIETPKYSFFKYDKAGDGFRKVFFTPFPALFNYGCIEGTRAADGMAKDAVVLGSRLSQGSVIEADKADGVAYFVDDSLRDDKNIFCRGGCRNTLFLSLYFRFYVLCKIVLYLLLERRFAKCRFEGIEWF